MEELILSLDEKHVELAKISDDEGYIPTKDLLCDFFHDLGFRYHSCTYSLMKKKVLIEIKPTFYFLSDFKKNKKICKLHISFKHDKEIVLKSTFTVFVQENRGDMLKKLWQEIIESYQQAMKTISNLSEI